jgi:hypothetical protein
VRGNIFCSQAMQLSLRFFFVTLAPPLSRLTPLGKKTVSSAQVTAHLIFFFFRVLIGTRGEALLYLLPHGLLRAGLDRCGRRGGAWHSRGGDGGGNLGVACPLDEACVK